MDVGEILDLPREKRFQKIIEHQKAFSPAILFLNGPKIAESPYRWAPSTFLYPWDQMQGTCFLPPQIFGTQKLGTQSPNGLIVDLPGFLLSASKPSSGSEFFAINKTQGGDRLIYFHTVAEGGFKNPGNGPLPELSFIPEQNPEDGSSYIVGAILLLASLDAPMPGYKHTKPSHVEGLVISNVEATSADGQLLNGRCEARVKVYDTNHWLHLLQRYPGVEFEQREDGKQMVKISEMPALVGHSAGNPLQKWCVR